ncbi:MAG: recombinase zinc beta ribbon domain-containing protein [Methylococcales bacterium]|nr:recombinase zinc beta ribbon domain-containing protein [Methylococcales bacterium]
MANRLWRSHDIELEYAFDRLQATRLEQAFAILVPNRERHIDESTELKGESHENSRHLCPRLFGSAEGGEDASLPDGGADRVCPSRKAPHSGTPEDQLLIQFQGMIAEYERAQILARQRMTRPLRLRGGISTRNSANIELPHSEWIEIPVPALVSEETFALAQEKLTYNKQYGPRHTIEPSILQGLVHCRQCSYALYRNSSRTSARKIYYYRCTGSDAYRHGGKVLCDEQPIRQELLDQLVWNEILHLLESPTLIKNELNRRLEAARDSSPTKRRLETLNRDIIRVRKSMERLLTAYQEELLSIDELRIRMPPLRQREQAMQAELQAITHQTADRAAYLRLAEIFTAFLERLRSNADTLDMGQRQKIMRLLVKEVIVGKELITIKHSIPVQATPAAGNPKTSKSPTQQDTAQSDKSSLLCKGGA